MPRGERDDPGLYGLHRFRDQLADRDPAGDERERHRRHTKAIDSLLNFETVKYFTAEEREKARYDNPSPATSA